MRTITVITPSNIEVEYRLAGVGSRMAAFLVDYFIQLTLIVVSAIVILVWFDQVIFSGATRLFDSPAAPSGVALGIWLVFSFMVWSGYFILCEQVMNGQSIGKRLLGLRVIRDNGQPLEFWRSLLRGLLRGFLDMYYVGLILILFSAKNKRLGDMAAGTIVISEHYNEASESQLMDAAHTWPNFLPDPFLLTSEERRLTEEWLVRRDSLPDGGRELGERIIAYLSKYNVQVEVQTEMQTEGEILHESFSNQWQPTQNGEYGSNA